MMPPGGVHLVQHPAAENMAVGVDVSPRAASSRKTGIAA
jgi:hypothetical protein